MIFSTGLKLGGVEFGEPRRTNMGMSYLDNGGASFEALWLFTTLTTVMGGVIMTIAAIMYFIVFFGTVFSKQVNESGIVELPITEAYHDEEDIGIFRNYTPWVITALIIIAVSYYGPIKNAIDNNVKSSPTYLPDSPTPHQTNMDKIELIESLEE